MTEQPPEPTPSRTKGMGAVGLACLAIAALLHVSNMFLGVGAAVARGEEPDERLFLVMIGLMFVFALAGIVILFLKVLIDRLTSREDNYYSRNVER